MISGVQKLHQDGDPIKGYGFGYGFDAIGNRTASTVDGGSGQRQTTYAANELNQYTSITSPGFEHLIGSAAINATVTANWTPEGNPPPALQPSDIVRALRQGNRWYMELGADNDPDPVWKTATVRGVVREGIVENGVAKDAIQSEDREIFIPAATQALTHDADGNLLSDGRWNYSWDANNRIITVESVTATPGPFKRKVEYAYDYMGRMVRRIEHGGFDQGSYADSSTIVIVYDGWNPIVELDAAGTVLRRYYWGLDLSGTLQGAGGVGGLLWMEDATANKAYAYCFDGNGNVVGLVDLADGSVAATYEYGPFGEPLVATGPAAEVNPFRFSTKRTDPVTGLVYYGYRHYYPGLGRWLSRDPIGEADGTNVFATGANQAPNGIDVLGHNYVGTINTTSNLALLQREEGALTFARTDIEPDIVLTGMPDKIATAADSSTILRAAEIHIRTNTMLWTGGGPPDYTPAGFREMRDHELRRIEVYYLGYQEYFSKAQGSYVNGRSLCGRCAEQKLRQWLEAMREQATKQFVSYALREQAEIGNELTFALDMHGAPGLPFDHFAWTHRVRSPSPFTPPVFPTSAECSP